MKVKTDRFFIHMFALFAFIIGLSVFATPGVGIAATEILVAQAPQPATKPQPPLKSPEESVAQINQILLGYVTISNALTANLIQASKSVRDAESVLPGIADLEQQVKAQQTLLETEFMSADMRVEKVGRLMERSFKTLAKVNENLAKARIGAAENFTILQAKKQ